MSNGAMLRDRHGNQPLYETGAPQDSVLAKIKYQFTPEDSYPIRGAIDDAMLKGWAALFDNGQVALDYLMFRVSFGWWVINPEKVDDLLARKALMSMVMPVDMRYIDKYFVIELGGIERLLGLK